VKSCRSSHQFLLRRKRGRHPASLERIKAVVLAINSADDERNPPETSIEQEAMKRVKSGSLYLIPASTETRGHGTTGMAKFYKQQLDDLLARAPQRGM
jgi:homoserine O-acetyltransferase